MSYWLCCHTDERDYAEFDSALYLWSCRDLLLDLVRGMSLSAGAAVVGLANKL